MVLIYVVNRLWVCPLYYHNKCGLTSFGAPGTWDLWTPGQILQLTCEIFGPHQENQTPCAEI